MTSRTPPKDSRLNRRGAFLNGVWHCDCEPRMPADKFQTKNGGKNHGRWFYTCQKPQPKRCKFFLWSDDAKLREEAVVLNNSRSESDPRPQTPQKYSTTHQQLTPNTHSGKSQYVQIEAQSDLDREDSYEWSPSADEDLAQAAETVSSTTPVETPRKAARTTHLTSPGKSGFDNSSSTVMSNPTMTSGEDVFATPSTSNKLNYGLLSPINTTSKKHAETSLQNPIDFSISPLATEVLQLLKYTTLTQEVERNLVEILNKYDLRTQGIMKGRDITRLAVQSKDKKIAELQSRIAGLEAERETQRAVIGHLKQDMATSPRTRPKKSDNHRTRSEI